MIIIRPTVLLSGLWLIALHVAPAHAGDGDDEEAPAPQAQPAPRAPTGYFEIGLGFSPDDDLIAHAAVVQSDLFGTGQRLALSADISALRHRFALVYEVPDLLDTGFDVRTELVTDRRAYPGFARQGTGGAVTVSRQLDRATRAYLSYRLEDVTMELEDRDDRALAPGLDARGADLGGGLLASLRAGIGYDTLDDRFAPRRGSRVEAYAEVSDPRLGSDRQLTRFGAALDHARSLGPLTLRLHGRGGYVHSRDSAGVPLSERLQHDGHADLRGYPMGAIDMVPIGGHRLSAGSDLELTGRVELEAPLWQRAGLYVAVFGDAGLRSNADPAYGETGTSVYPSAGLSLIWRSPIGPLRFDWAVPLDRDPNRDAWSPQFLFSFGQSF
jgi:outer membrane protein insertion porin family